MYYVEPYRSVEDDGSIDSNNTKFLKALNRGPTPLPPKSLMTSVRSY